jgi:hypothetical protein
VVACFYFQRYLKVSYFMCYKIHISAVIVLIFLKICASDCISYLETRFKFRVNVGYNNVI